MRNSNNKPIARSTIYRILIDPFYYGEFEYPKGSGNWYIGKHKPMITKEEYDKIQILLGRKGKPRPKKHQFAFTGLMKCGECGASITAEHKTKKQKNGNIHFYTYYHCTKRINKNCTQKCIRREDLEKQIKNTLETITIPPEFHEWALDVLKKENESESQDRNKILNSQQKAYNLCVKKIDNLIDMRASEIINDVEFKKKKREAEKEKRKFRELLDDTDNRIDNWLDRAEYFFDFAKNAKQSFDNGDLEIKRQILSTLGSHLLLKDKKLNIQLEEHFIPMQKAAQEVQVIHKGLEPLENGLNKQKLGHLYARSRVLLSGLDSNQQPIA